jgi:DNA-binding IclR family transcriptional regulator
MTAYSPADRICKLLKALQKGPLTITQLEETAGLQYAVTSGYLADLCKHGIVTESGAGIYALAPAWRGAC